MAAHSKFYLQPLASVYLPDQLQLFNRIDWIIIPADAGAKPKLQFREIKRLCISALEEITVPYNYESNLR